MIDKSHELPLAGQAKALGISRGSICHLAGPSPDADLALMRRIDALHLKHPFAGSWTLRDIHRAERREIGRRHVATLMKSSRDRGPGGAAGAFRAGVEAICRRPDTSKPTHDLILPAAQPMDSIAKRNGSSGD